jgi:hypothetical protein
MRPMYERVGLAAYHYAVHECPQATIELQGVGATMYRFDGLP